MPTFLERHDLRAEQSLYPLGTAHDASARLHRAFIAAVQLLKLEESFVQSVAMITSFGRKPQNIVHSCRFCDGSCGYVCQQTDLHVGTRTVAVLEQDQ